MDTSSLIDEFLKHHGAIFEETNGIALHRHYDTGVLEEIRFLTETAGVFVRNSDDLIRMEGPEAGKFFQGMVTNNLHTLKIGQLQPTLICTPKGKIIHQIDVIRRKEEEYILLCPPGTGKLIGGYLDGFHIREEFDMDMLSPRELRCDVIGPQAHEVLRSMNFPEINSVWQWQTHPITTVDYPLDAIPRFINLVPNEAYVNFLETLLRKSRLIGLVGEDAFDQVRIDLGIPRMNVDFGQDYFPQEASLMNHISYDKGCYIGQEPHSRMKHRGHPNRQLIGITIPRSLSLQAEQRLFHNQEEVGVVTSISGIESSEHYHGIAVIKYTIAQEKTLLSEAPESTPIIQQRLLATAKELSEE